MRILSTKTKVLQEFADGYLMVGLLSALVASIIIFSTLIPPFQSPDEFEHIKRAYLLTTGDIVLKTQGAESSGGQINTGLLEYLKQYQPYPFQPDQKITKDFTKAAEQIQWSQATAFSPVYAFASYFPGLYLPQATGLWIGKYFNLSVANSYYLARVLVILSSCTLLIISCLLFRPSAFVFAILFMPMSLYQLASPSLDGIATATFIFILSIFFYTVVHQQNSKGWLAIPMGISIFLLTASRAHSLPILLLLYYSFYITKNKKFLIAGIAASCLTALWLYISIKTTVDRRVINTVLPAEILHFYLNNVLTFFKVFIATVTNVPYMAFYARSVIGNLGWADWPQSQFSTITYYCLAALLIAIAGLSTSIKELKKIKWIRISLVGCAIASIFIVFFALLITWTTHPAKLIEGVQGRYFHFPLLLIAYAITGLNRSPMTTKELIANGLLALYIVFTFAITYSVLLTRYYE
jgi:uncharacterized membrane protein